MGTGISRPPGRVQLIFRAGAMAGVTLLVVAAPSIGVEPDERAGANPPAALRSPSRPPAKLVPFPEDEEQPVEAAQPTPRGLAPQKESDFQPRFKSPSVRQAQNTEPDEVGQPAEAEESSGPQLQPIPQSADPRDPPGRAVIDEAFAKSREASSDENYTEVIDLCRRGARAGLNKSYEDYARRLLGWAYNRRGETRVRAGQDVEALADFEAAVKCNGNSWRAVHNRGVSYASLGRTREALADFNRTIELNKQYGNAYFNRGELRYLQHDFPGAIRDYTAALKLSPGDAAILNTRGHAFYRLQRFGEALRDYSEALKVEPTFAPALVNRGDAYCDLGQYGNAANDYRAAVESNSKLGRAYQSAAWLMATCPDEHYRNPKLALDAARKASELDGQEDYRCLETLAAAQANSGQFAEAKQTQEKAVAQAPRGQAGPAQKRLALYQHEQAYRERPRFAVNKPEEDPQVRKASGASPPSRQRRPNPQ